MNIIRLGLKKIINLWSLIFYNHTFKFVLFIFTILTAKILQIEYKIKDFNYYVIIALYFITLILYLLFKRFFTKWYEKAAVIAVLLIAVLIYTVYNFEKIYIELKKLEGFAKSIELSFYNSTPTYFYQFQPFFLAAVPLFLFLMFYLERLGLAAVIIPVSLVYLAGFWFAGELFELKLYMLLYMVICSFTYCVYNIKRIYNKYKNGKIKISIESKRIINYFLIVSFIVSALSYVFVNKVNSKSLLISVNERLAKSNRMLNKSKNNRYDIADSGYASSSVKLGGPIKLNSDRVLKVKGEESYYLKGSVKDFYDGFSWNRNSLDYKQQEKEPLRLVTTSFYNHMKGKEKSGELEERSITVYPEALFNSSIFAPSFTYNIKHSYGYIAYDDTESYLILGDTGVKSPYSINFYKSNCGIEFFDKAYENNIEMDYSELYKDKKLKDKYSKYLKLPNNISPRIYDLVDSITKGAKTNGEKVKRIKDYLTKNYSYSLEVSELPDKAEFTDYFLFVEKKGYCTYFATAAAVMFRIAGIPARYVEGFAMSDVKDKDGLYIVTNEMAHAWTEILMYPEDDIWSIEDCTPLQQREQYIKTVKLEENTQKSTEVNTEEETSKVSKDRRSRDLLFKLNKYIMYLFIAIITSGIILTVIKFIGLKLKVRKILGSNSSVPLYCYVRKRLEITYSNSIIPEDDYVWLDNIHNDELKNILKELIDAVYRETYRKSLCSELNKKHIYYYIEKYIKTKQSIVKYNFYKIFKS